MQVEESRKQTAVCHESCSALNRHITPRSFCVAICASFRTKTTLSTASPSDVCPRSRPPPRAQLDHRLGRLCRGSAPSNAYSPFICPNYLIRAIDCTIIVSVSKRYIPMLLRRILVSLGVQHLQRLDQPLARLSWLNDGIHISPLSRDIRRDK